MIEPSLTVGPLPRDHSSEPRAQAKTRARLLRRRARVSWLSLNSCLELETKSKLYLARRTRVVGGPEQSGCGVAKLQESCVGRG
ncbi:MAG: hypothetical protein QOI77_3202 [Blastocatellia bacterium]|nr:hypothetical protein [Blastocatellia bacterium]